MYNISILVEMRSKEIVKDARNFVLVGIFAVSLPAFNPQEDDYKSNVSCIARGGVLFCDNFRIEKPFSNVGNVYDIVLYVENWRSFGKWREALRSGWTDGLNYMGQRGCELVDNPDDRYYQATRRITTVSSCLSEIDSPAP